jgi:hypothetical protein
MASEENFQKCLEHGVYGATKVSLERVNSEIIAGMETIKAGDFIFFYVRNHGVHGLWKATSSPFVDDGIDIWGEAGKYPYAVCFEPVVRHFPKPIALNDIFDLRDTGKVWTFDLGMVRNKNHYPITKDEARELTRLLLRNNPISYSPTPIPKPYAKSEAQLPIQLDTDRSGHVNFEGYLNAWFIRSFAGGGLKSLIGEYEDFLNFVPTSFNSVMDIFLTHVTNVDGIDVLHKFTCMELKTPVGTEEDLRQLVRYEDWLARKLANGDHEMVQSILVAFDFQAGALEYVRKRKRIDEKTVRLIRYRVTEDKQDILLDEIE